MSATLLQLPNYVKAFGLIDGLALFATVCVFRRPRGKEFGVRMQKRTVRMRNTASDTAIFFQVMVKQEYETKNWPAHHVRLANAYDSLVNAGKTPIIVDAGANIGLASLWFAERYPGAKVYAIEPDDTNLSLVRRNVSAKPNIVVLPGAVWDRPAKLRIANPDAGAGSFRIVEDEGDLETYTIPEIVAMESNGALFIVKIDIEGGEAALFRSNTHWAADAELIVIETHDWLYPAEGTSSNFRRRIADLSVDLLFRGENIFCFRYTDWNSRPARLVDEI